MNLVERFQKLMNFEPVDRIPYMEWAGYWDKTLKNWYDQGLVTDIEEHAYLRQHLGLDLFFQKWFMPRGSKCPEPKAHGAGIIQDEKDYYELKEHLFPEPAFEEEALRKWQKLHDKGKAVIWFTFEGFFWFPRSLFGIENHMYAFYDKPDLMHRINRDITEYHLSILERMPDIMTPDFMTFAEDMSYNHGPMLSKELFDEFLAPYYETLIPEIKKQDVIPFVDSDGDVNPLIPWLKEVGIKGILPLERAAHIDINEIRKDHPDFLMIGAYDKRVLYKGKDAIKAEFERIFPVMKQGGFIPSVDHQTPPDVTLYNYGIYVSMLQKYCKKAAG